jgi:ferredoxin
MIVNHGYRDGSGTFIISIDSEKCSGCGACVPVCPNQVLEIAIDPYEPLEEKMVALVTEAHRKKLKYSCAQCKPAGKTVTPPCVAACPAGAMKHSW